MSALWCVDMKTLAEIEAAIPRLSADELKELERLLQARRLKMGSGSNSPTNLWSGARARLQRIWGQRVLTESEIAEMREFEDGP